MDKDQITERLKFIYNDRLCASTQRDEVYRLLDGIEKLVEDLSGDKPVDKVGMYNVDYDKLEDH